MSLLLLLPSRHYIILPNGGKRAPRADAFGRKYACPVNRDRCASDFRALIWAMPMDFLSLMKPTAQCHIGGSRATAKQRQCQCVQVQEDHQGVTPYPALGLWHLVPAG